jgi:hypothetical protein
LRLPTSAFPRDFKLSQPFGGDAQPVAQAHNVGAKAMPIETDSLRSNAKRVRTDPASISPQIVGMLKALMRLL